MREILYSHVADATSDVQPLERAIVHEGLGELVRANIACVAADAQALKPSAGQLESGRARARRRVACLRPPEVKGLERRWWHRGRRRRGCCLARRRLALSLLLLLLCRVDDRRLVLLGARGRGRRFDDKAGWRGEQGGAKLGGGAVAQPIIARQVELFQHRQPTQRVPEPVRERIRVQARPGRRRHAAVR